MSLGVTYRYPFHVPSGDAALVQTVKLMLHHMRNQQYIVPPELKLSPACRDLLAQLLHPDAKVRIKTEGILSHPWFQQGLPADALKMNDRWGRGQWVLGYRWGRKQ